MDKSSSSTIRKEKLEESFRELTVLSNIIDAENHYEMKNNPSSTAPKEQRIIAIKQNPDGSMSKIYALRTTVSSSINARNPIKGTRSYSIKEYGLPRISAGYDPRRCPCPTPNSNQNESSFAPRRRVCPTSRAQLKPSCCRQLIKTPPPRPRSPNSYQLYQQGVQPLLSSGSRGQACRRPAAANRQSETPEGAWGPKIQTRRQPTSQACPRPSANVYNDPLVSSRPSRGRAAPESYLTESESDENDSNLFGDDVDSNEFFNLPEFCTLSEGGRSAVVNVRPPPSPPPSACPRQPSRATGAIPKCPLQKKKPCDATNQPFNIVFLSPPPNPSDFGFTSTPSGGYERYSDTYGQPNFDISSLDDSDTPNQRTPACYGGPPSPPTPGPRSRFCPPVAGETRKRPRGQRPGFAQTRRKMQFDVEDDEADDVEEEACPLIPPPPPRTKRAVKTLTVMSRKNECGGQTGQILEEDIYSDDCEGDVAVRSMVRGTIDPFEHLQSRMGQFARTGNVLERHRPRKQSADGCPCPEEVKRRGYNCEKSADETLNEVIDATMRSFEQIAKLITKRPPVKCVLDLPTDRDKLNKLLEESIARTESDLSLLRKNMGDTLIELSSIFARRANQNVPEIDCLMRHFERKKCPGESDAEEPNRDGAQRKPSTAPEAAAPEGAAPEAKGAEDEKVAVEDVGEDQKEGG